MATIDIKLKSYDQLVFEITKLNTDIYLKDKEIARLKNGIKELDNMFYETFRISQNGYYSISEWELKGFTDKLQELKGDDKNDKS